MKNVKDYLANKRFLVVEDDEMMRENILYFLEHLGNQVVAAFENGCFDAIAPYLEKSDFILMDINLSGEVTGVQLALKIREVSNIPIIYITGNADESAFEKASDTNIYGYLPKPFNKSQFEYTLKVAFLRDLHEMEKEKQYKEIKEKEKLIQIGEFAGGFIHDINNYNALIGASFSRIKRYTENTKSLNEEADKIYHYCQKGEVGSEKITKLAGKYRRILLAKTNQEKEVISLNKVTKELKAFFELSLMKDDIKLEIICPATLMLYTCEIILMQAFINLIKNAIYELLASDCTDKWIKVEVKEHQDRVTIEVSDSGKGVPIEIRDEIFETGFSTKVENGDHGTGLGLAFVKKSIESELDGNISLLNDVDYTTFEIVLPKKAA